MCVCCHSRARASYAHHTHATQSPHPHPHPQQVGYPDGRLVSPTAVAASGASVLNLHQGVDGWLAPHINSPLQPLAATRLGGYVARAHALGLRAKLYYTVRHICT